MKLISKENTQFSPFYPNQDGMVAVVLDGQLIQLDGDRFSGGSYH
jgi:hypothetical protein